MITKKVELNKFIDDDGVLIPVEFEKYLDFVPKRSFSISDVPVGITRGGHAHFRTKQFLICVSGSISVILYDGREIESHHLIKGQAIYIDKMIWDSEVFLEQKTVVYVLCSTNYDKNDYIEDKTRFEELVSTKRVQFGPEAWDVMSKVLDSNDPTGKLRNHTIKYTK